MYKMQYTNYKNPNNVNVKWCISTISNILKDRVYIGDLVQHKYSSINYKIKRVVKVEKNKNIIIENNHEAIISKEDFEKVQQMLLKKSNECKRNTRNVHVLTGIAFCKNCGARITYTKNHSNEFKIICSNYKKNGKNACSNIYVNEEYVIKVVINKIIENIKKQNFEKILIKKQTDSIKKLEELKLQKAKNLNAIKQLYVDLSNNKIEEEIARNIIEEYIEENKKIDIKISKNYEKPKEINVVKIINESSIERLRSLIFLLIEKIEVSKKEIKIYYKFKNYF